jgi:hypothetical protein
MKQVEQGSMDESVWAVQLVEHAGKKVMEEK